MLRRKTPGQINKHTKPIHDVESTSNFTLFQRHNQDHGSGISQSTVTRKPRSANAMIWSMIQFLFFLSVGYIFMSYTFFIAQQHQDDIIDEGDILKLDSTTTITTTTTTSSSLSKQNEHEKPPGNSSLGDGSVSTGNTSNSENLLHKDMNMKDVIMDQMKVKLKEMPSPAWPQLDHRTAEAMTSGVVLGVENYTDFHFNHTIVTAYYEFKSKHSVKEYKKWMIGLFQTSDPIIIFVEPKSTWFDVVQELRQHSPTLVVPLKFDDLVMSSTFTNEFWDHEHSIDTEASIHKGSGVYKIWNEKMIFIYNAIHLNPFRSEGFAWMDTGYFRQLSDAPDPGTPIVRLDYHAAGVPKEKILVMHVRNDPLTAVARVNIAGNCFFGAAEAFLEFYKNYYTTFWDWIKVKDKFIGSDQFVMTETCRRYASNCYPYFAGRYKFWFSLSAVIMKKKKMYGISPHFLFLENPPASLPELPEGKKVSYCNGHVLPADDSSCG